MSCVSECVRTMQGIVDVVARGLIAGLVQGVVAGVVGTVVRGMVVGELGGVAEGLVCTVPKMFSVFFAGHNRGHVVDPYASLAAYISVVIYILLGILGILQYYSSINGRLSRFSLVDDFARHRLKSVSTQAVHSDVRRQ